MDMAFGGGFGGGAGLAMNAQGGGPNQPLQEVERVRSDFPETWLWSNATVGYGVLCSRRVQRSLIVCIDWRRLLPPQSACHCYSCTVQAAISLPLMNILHSTDWRIRIFHVFCRINTQGS